MALDLGFLLNARQTLLPLPLVDSQSHPRRDVLPPLRRRSAAGLDGALVVGSGGGGAVRMIGMARAFEEAGTRPAAISVCSASALWGAMWAAGLSAEEMAALALAWRPEDHLGVQWTGLPRLAVSTLRGFTGLARGRALEQLFDRRTWRMAVGHTEIPLRVLAYDIDRGRFERLGTGTTPDLTLGELARVAVAPPRRAEAVRLEGRFYVDGGAAKGCHPMLLTDGLDASATLESATDGPGFYGVFLDRRRWPDLIREGYDSVVRPTRTRRSASPS